MTGPDPMAELADVDEMIALISGEISRHGRGHAEYGQQRYELGVCRMIRFSLSGTRADLDAGISDFEDAVAAIPRTDPVCAIAQASLAGALTERFQRADDPADLDAAINAANAALDVARAGGASANEAIAVSLGTLGMALSARYQRSGHIDDLNEAISQLRAAADAGRAGEMAYAVNLGNLGVSLRLRFERTSDPADLDAAIKAGQQAVAVTPPENLDRPEYLVNLGIAFMRRFQQFGALSDADDAIMALRSAAAGLPPGHSHYAGWQSNLATVLMGRHDRTGDLADLEAAVAAAEEAVAKGEKSDPRWAGMASTAGLALFRRYKRAEDPDDLDAAIAMIERSVAAMPLGHPDYAAPRTQLATMLHARFERGEDPADLNAAIRATYEALDATPAGHVEHGNALVNLGVALRARFRVTGLPADRDAALAVLRRATAETTARTSVRARAAVGAGLLAMDDPALAAGLLEDAVRLLAQAAPRRLARDDQEHIVGIFTGLAGAAASAALADPSVPEARRPARALALLEASRAVLFSQALDTRDDVSDLRRDHPALARRFVRLREELDQPERDPAPGDALAGLGWVTAERDRLAGEFAQVLREIRALSGYATFGLPPSVEELRAQAADGPVITFTVSDASGGALLLTTDGITFLDLPRLTQDAVSGRVASFHEALRDTASDDDEVVREAEAAVTATLAWLWDAAVGPVLGELGFQAPHADGTPWPRVWWVPGGLLGLLPLHAAGHAPATDSVGEDAGYVMDRVISSYTPTVRALRYARQRARRDDGAGRALIVAMPVTPGAQPLPGAAAEVRRIRGMLPDPVVLDQRADEAVPAAVGLPTRENVLRYLPECTIAHFACHAHSDAANPSRSLLMLLDHEAAPFTVAALAPVDHERLELTYLSACNTAVTASTRLADEAIHLTSAFQLAGSRHVIGTLWPASDLMALRVATRFYTGLRDGDGPVDTARAARALHHAVRAIREKWPASPSLWAPYMHAGA